MSEYLLGVHGGFPFFGTYGSKSRYESVESCFPVECMCGKRVAPLLGLLTLDPLVHQLITAEQYKVVKLLVQYQLAVKNGIQIGLHI